MTSSFRRDAPKQFLGFQDVAESTPELSCWPCGGSASGPFPPSRWRRSRRWRSGPCAAFLRGARGAPSVAVLGGVPGQAARRARDGLSSGCLPVRVATAALRRSPALGAKAFQLWESLLRLELRPLEISQAAAGWSRSSGAGSCNAPQCARAGSLRDLAACKTLALQPWSAAQLAHTGDNAALPVIRHVPRSPRTSLPVYRRRTPSVRPLARLLSQGQIPSHQRGSLPRRRTNCRTSRADRPLSPSDQNNPRNACCARAARRRTMDGSSSLNSSHLTSPSPLRRRVPSIGSVSPLNWLRGSTPQPDNEPLSRGRTTKSCARRRRARNYDNYQRTKIRKSCASATSCDCGPSPSTPSRRRRSGRRGLRGEGRRVTSPPR